MKSITSKYLLGNDGKNHGELKNISNQITDYWDKIMRYNVLPKNMERKYDGKALIEKIEELAETRIMYKLYMQCINMGYTKLSELPTNHNYLNIFIANEKKEMLFKLSKIPTINPKLKRAKGKANMNTTEDLTSDWIAKKIREIQRDYDEVSQKLSEFNEKATLELDGAALSLVALNNVYINILS